MTMHPAVSNGSYDVARVREDFPALALKVYGKPLVYLDNAASAQKPNAVLDRMTEAYKTEYANVHRGLHYLANAATEAYEGGRAKVATVPQRRAHRRDRLHPQRHRGDQPGGVVLGRAEYQARATRSCSRSWSITPTSCPGISSGNARAP